MSEADDRLADEKKKLSERYDQDRAALKDKVKNSEKLGIWQHLS
jgi:hypothetical protein